MRKVSSLLVLIFSFLPVITFAAGSYCEGYVNIFHAGNNAYSSLTGSMNVRWSSDAGQISSGTAASGKEYIEVKGYSGNSHISIRARDNGDQFFSCSIPPSSKLYEDAKALTYSGGAQNGVQLTVIRGLGTDLYECSHLYVAQHSCHQN